MLSTRILKFLLVLKTSIKHVSWMNSIFAFLLGIWNKYTAWMEGCNTCQCISIINGRYVSYYRINILVYMFSHKPQMTLLDLKWWALDSLGKVWLWYIWWRSNKPAADPIISSFMALWIKRQFWHFTIKSEHQSHRPKGNSSGIIANSTILNYCQQCCYIQ